MKCPQVCKKHKLRNTWDWYLYEPIHLSPLYLGSEKSVSLHLYLNLSLNLSSEICVSIRDIYPFINIQHSQNSLDVETIYSHLASSHPLLSSFPVRPHPFSPPHKLHFVSSAASKVKTWKGSPWGTGPIWLGVQLVSNPPQRNFFNESSLLA